MRLSKPPPCEYDPDLHNWLRRLSSEASSALQLIGSYLQLTSTGDYPGYIGFNRAFLSGTNFAAGVNLITTKPAYIMAHVTDYFYLLTYNAGGALVASMNFDVNGNMYITGQMSADSYVDRTPFYEGDAVAELKTIVGKDGQLDHDTLPKFMARTITGPAMPDPSGEAEPVELKGRDLGAAVTMLVSAIKQLDARLEKLEQAIIKG